MCLPLRVSDGSACIVSCSGIPNCLQPFGLQPARLLCPWDSPGRNIGVGCHFLLQEIFPTRGLNPGLPHCGQRLYRLRHQGNPQDSTCSLSKVWFQSLVGEIKSSKVGGAAKNKKKGMCTAYGSVQKHCL